MENTDAETVPAFHQDLETTLTDFQRNLVLGAFPEGATIVKSQYFDNYDLPCPIRVDVVLACGQEETVVLRSARRGSVELEANLLRVLGRLGLPVPRILAEPALGPAGRSMVVLSMLPGRNLQKFSMESAGHLQASKKILLEGISRLSGLSGSLAEDPIYHSIPHWKLPAQLQGVMDRESDWRIMSVFQQALEVLRPALADIRIPLVFTNGDYQPANFLTDGRRVTGFVDFEAACFQDPLIGFAKYPIYDIHPMNRAGLIDSMLESLGFSPRDFAPRLALGCLMTLQKEIPVRPATADERSYKEHVLTLLSDSIDLMAGRQGR